ncbi:MAG: thioredoxin family protein [Anaerolineales bacterium]|nr:thioredoxin family protein [Anaerolineales bacterium]
MIKLQVYISADCWSCEETERIVTDVAARLPEVEVELVDMATHEKPDNVFAIPTYLINGRVVFLGNPTREELYQKLQAIQNKVQM